MVFTDQEVLKLLWLNETRIKQLQDDDCSHNKERDVRATLHNKVILAHNDYYKSRAVTALKASFSDELIEEIEMYAANIETAKNAQQKRDNIDYYSGKIMLKIVEKMYQRNIIKIDLNKFTEIVATCLSGACNVSKQDRLSLTKVDKIINKMLIEC